MDKRISAMWLTLTIFVLFLVMHSIAAQNYSAQSNANASNGTYIAVNLTSELNNSHNMGYNFTANQFQSNSTSQCYLALITFCNNKMPSQFVCINVAYNQTYQAQRAILIPKSVECPDYLLGGFISCGLQNGYCVVTRNANSAINYNSTSTQTTLTTTIPYTSVQSSISEILSDIVQFLNNLFRGL